MRVATSRGRGLWERLFVHGCTYVAEHMDVRERPPRMNAGYSRLKPLPQVAPTDQNFHTRHAINLAGNVAHERYLEVLFSPTVCLCRTFAQCRGQNAIIEVLG